MGQQEPLEQLTEPAKKVLRLAWKEALGFQHHYIGVEHLLLGLIDEGQGVVAHVLQQFGVDRQAVQDMVEYIIGHGDHPALEPIKLTPRTMNVLRQAGDDACQLGSQLIGTEHLLLGLVHENAGLAKAVFDRLNVTSEQVREKTLVMLGGAS